VGADFLERTRRSFQKAWDRQKVRRHEDELFSRLPSEASRTFAADLAPGGIVRQGDPLIVEAVRGALVVSVGNAEVARSDHPPADLVEALTGSCGIAKGSVRNVHTMAGVIEIAIEQ
jgi:hypothetical protein